MTSKEDIIRMAREAGFKLHHNPDLYDCMVASDKAIEHFAELVRADEREACAKVCDALHYEADAYGAQCAAAIRARGQA
jgi:hypothetical protein